MYMSNATVPCVCTRMRTCASVRVCACVTIVVHTVMYAVIGILCNMQVFNYLFGNLKYRLHVTEQCNCTVCVHAYAYVRERACVCVRNHSCTHCYVCCNLYSTQYASI